jgi:cytochrome c553
VGLFLKSAFAVGLILTATAVLAEPVGNPISGKLKSDSERCQECHGAEGFSVSEKIPNHAGQQAAYLIKQLADFQSGRRHHETMSVMAADLDDADIADIAAYFASQKMMQGDGSVGLASVLAKSLLQKGDDNRHLPACASCHGENAKGRLADGVVYPVLAGQRKIYLRTQLVNWKLAERTNSPDGVMNKIAQQLSDDEIEALSSYLAGLK